jgi:regulator of protease activity HflC (stomatin/prohibitin superfamily)
LTRRWVLVFGPVECLGVLAVVAGLAVPLFLFLRGTVTIGEGVIAVVERRGRYSRQLHAGLHLLLPGAESIRAFVPLQEFIYESGPQRVLTRNLAPVTVNLSVHYQIARHAVVEGNKRWHRIEDDAVYHAVYSSENWQEATHSAARAALAETFSFLDLEEDILNVPDWQNQVALLVRQRLGEKARRWGVQVTDVAFTQPEFSKEVTEAIIRRSQAEHEARRREVEAASLKEVAERLGLSPSELIHWRYVETLREIARNPEARIVVSADPFAEGDHPTAATTFAELERATH